jgi:hypothetical protein
VTVTERAGRLFDWRPRFDPRSLNFRAALRVTAMPASPILWDLGPVLDQGNEGACVGYGCAGAVASAPSSRTGVNDTYARTWYRRAQRLDEWQGESYDGTSVLAGCLVGRERKLWSGFRWAKQPAELAAGILNPALGPAVVGVQWSEDLYETGALLDTDVRLDPELGHCVLLPGYLPADAWENSDRDARDQLEELGLADAVHDLEGPGFVVLNSWGTSWGAGGLAVAGLELVQRWFRARGEFALPENRTKGRTTMAATEDQAPAEMRAGDETMHVTAAEVLEGDRILDPPEELGQESATVTAQPRHTQAWGGRRVTIPTTAGSFQLGAGDAVTVRRST